MKKAKIEATLGDITKIKVDAIVNAAHEALQSGGGVDGAIHRAAGPALLRSCKLHPEVEPGVRCRVGEAKLTSGFNLPAKYIIHTVAPRFAGAVQTGLMGTLYNNATEGTDDDLANCYLNCLKTAENVGAKSVAFPSLGTGGHAYPIEIACPIAVRAVRQHFKSGTARIETVKFVCFSDSDLKHYQEELSK